MAAIALHVWGDYACFTRPEMKVERVSYEVMTPSSARAICEAIFWKPALCWVIDAIDVLRPIRFTTLRRNEVKVKASTRNEGIYIESSRQQRAATLLRDVEYVIHARMIVKPECRRDYPEGKVQEMFRRRASKGQCFMQPYLGCREFPAHFRLLEEEAQPSPLADLNCPLGYMLHDLDFTEPDNPQPRFFYARLEEGRLHVPAPDSGELRA